MPSGFLSYSRADLPLIERLVAHLQAPPSEITIRRDHKKIYVGQKWPKFLGEAIADQDFFLLAWSKKSATLHFVEFEWCTAIALKKTIVTCLLDDTALAQSLKTFHGYSLDDVTELRRCLRAAPLADAQRQKAVIASLDGIAARDQEAVLKQAKSIFARQQWTVQENIYQAGGDIHIYHTPALKDSKVRSLGKWEVSGNNLTLSRTPKWWQFWKRHDSPPGHNLPDQSEPDEPEPVLLGASAPRKVTQGQAFTARFVAYAQTVEEKIREKLESLGPDSPTHLALRTCRWKLGTDVAVHLSGQYLEVQYLLQTFKWEGGYSLVDFDIHVENTAPSETTTLRYDILIHDVIVARVRLDIRISGQLSSQEITTTSCTPAQTAFASYASQDRLRVMDRIAAVKISAGLDVWVDCLSLNPADQWKSRLRQEICQRDLFLLFWSRHAKDSPWVSWEWHTALEEKGELALQLHPLETPQEAPPPNELKHLHFGDPAMLARKALE